MIFIFLLGFEIFADVNIVLFWQVKEFLKFLYLFIMDIILFYFHFFIHYFLLCTQLIEYILQFFCILWMLFCAIEFNFFILKVFCQVDIINILWFFNRNAKDIFISLDSFSMSRKFTFKYFCIFQLLLSWQFMPISSNMSSNIRKIISL